MGEKHPLDPRKRPVQSRSRQMFDLILDSAARILTEEGATALTTNRVAEDAGIAVGSLYQYFPNKAAIVAELTRRHKERMITVFGGFTPGDGETGADFIRRIVRTHIAIHKSESKLHIALAQLFPDESVFSWSDEVEAGLTQTIRSLIAAHPDVGKVADADLIRFIVRCCVQTVVHRALSERPEALESGAIEAELTRLLTPYLSGNAARP